MCTRYELASKGRLIKAIKPDLPPLIVRGYRQCGRPARCYAANSISSEATTVIIGERLRAWREQRNLSQGDIQKRTGLKRCYISRVENGHTVPGIGTLEKMTRALEVPMYQLFYEGENPPTLPDLAMSSNGRETEWLGQFYRVVALTNDDDRQLLLRMAQKMANANHAKA